MDNTLDDLTGKSFGLMQVLRKAARGRGTTTQWECRCSGCGTVVIQRRDHLRRGKFDRCRGHVRRGKGNHTSTRPPGYSAATEVYGIYRQRARKTGRPFELTREEFVEIASRPCHYCGSEPAQLWGDRGQRATRHNGTFAYNGLDRVNSEDGYSAANCVACCGRCNSMKSDLPLPAFLEHVRKLFEHSHSGRPTSSSSTTAGSRSSLPTQAPEP